MDLLIMWCRNKDQNRRKKRDKYIALLYLFIHRWRGNSQVENNRRKGKNWPLKLCTLRGRINSKITISHQCPVKDYYSSLLVVISERSDGLSSPIYAYTSFLFLLFSFLSTFLCQYSSVIAVRVTSPIGKLPLQAGRFRKKLNAIKDLNTRVRLYLALVPSPTIK